MSSVEADESRAPVAITNQVYRWPEFQALVKRLGRAVRLDRSLVIKFAMDQEVIITQEYLACDRGPDSE